MRFFVSAALALLSTGVQLVGQTSPELSRAQQDLTRLKELVAAGAMAPARLQDAQQSLADAMDDQVLHRTLYGRMTVQDLTEEQSQEMVAAAQRRLERQQDKFTRQQKLVDEGVIARGELAPIQEEIESRKLTLDLATSRAKLLTEIAEAAHREQEAELATVLPTPTTINGMMVRYDGDGTFNTADSRDVERAFEKQFGKPMPVSARGETGIHRALGFDHRGRIDVALNPDQAEGVWLRAYLEKNEIPYYAFRGAIRGKATGAHIHIGPGSTRLRASD